ncbi:histidine kinase dimerization/phosphoacceptor domain -containing protein [Methylobacterium planeticum]|uniref:histidine kinase n=1 Tax=Methylobacterium planeticum TaxID=2615211 RepID=A0A6N6MUQ0_9HYPH|nr:histidine kinase dimerization/phosphoacceptor domain -containing protein [Methylobacterium planeticum]KAB1073387.1 PAS domain-containing protein [Methylobacterium planeticum]
MEQAEARRLAGSEQAEFGRGAAFAAAMREARMPMIVTDPRRHDNPIVFANAAFLRLTGYERLDVTGRNCRFLQGPGTCPEAVARVRAAIRDEVDIHIDLLNYRKDGTTFHNALYLSPVHGDDGSLRFFFAAQHDVTDRYRMLEKCEQANRTLQGVLDLKTTLIHEIDHRVKNNLQMISAMIVLQSQSIPDPAVRRSLSDTLQRIEALSTVHRLLHQSETVSRFDVADFVRDLVTDLVGATGRRDIRVELDLASVVVAAEKSTALALLVNEIVTNVLKHAFVKGRAGSLAIRIGRAEDRVLLVVEDDGVGIATEAAGTSSFGQSLMRTLARQLGAELIVEGGARGGTRVSVRMPAAVALPTQA